MCVHHSLSRAPLLTNRKDTALAALAGDIELLNCLVSLETVWACAHPLMAFLTGNHIFRKSALR
jgi:hypothetical protein